MEYADLLRTWSRDMAANEAGTLDPIALMRYIYAEWGQLGREPEDVCYRHEEFGALKGVWTLPQGADEGTVILYFHGGGYIGGTCQGVRKLLGHMSRAGGTLGFSLEYRLAPEHPFPAQLDDALTAFDWLVARGFAPGRIIVAGDSAGGALATAVTLKRKEAGLPLPGAVVALSPFYDISATLGSWDYNDGKDMMGNRDTLLAIRPVFLGDSYSPTDRFVDALYADPSGFPPMFISAGGHELLLDGAVEFAGMARGKGVEVELEVVPEMQHVFHYACGYAAEADTSLARIGEFLRKHVGRNPPAA